ncbi:hypothetical protein HK097_005864 [Rhizophlyctis rosea]|uniref:Uncharacterized protein n=1 Tax=Rhizophlyctis rosea TaxID=64517 RepID=A0AAD5SD70_9FUNG|nr:hypothetical protein HK097_005864 [Rhizophlyctis rosea]
MLARRSNVKLTLGQVPEGTRAAPYSITTSYTHEDIAPHPSTLGFTSSGRYGWPHDDFEAYTTVDSDDANTLFRQIFYDRDGWPKSPMTGFDIEHRQVPGFDTPALIQGFNPTTAESIAWRTPTLMACHDPRWVKDYLREPEITKWGLAIEGDVKMLVNAGMTNLQGFQRSDDVIIWHQRHLGRQRQGYKVAMDWGAKEYLGIMNVTVTKGG